jgi:NAD(P)-dependent dehydrogenase (short-subunit alcohol dehydrogenase family)
MTSTVLITGASSGIGHATARHFAVEGWNVIATSRGSAPDDPAGLPNVLVTRLDVQDASSIEQAIEEGIARFGRIDALVNNAGFSLFGVFEGIPPEKIREQFDVNAFGMMDVTRAVLPHFRQNKAGVIVNISSRAGLVGLPMVALYCAAKHALEGFSEALAFVLAAQNIKVKIVEPSGGVTGTTFSRRMGEEHGQVSAPADYDQFVARMNAVFASNTASRVTTADEVAGVIFGAATDGTDRLRYFVGEDTGGLVAAKRAMADQDYVDLVRARFRARPPASG